MKLALLSNVGLELVADLFRPADEVWTPSGFGAWRQVSFELPEDLRVFAPDLVVLLLDPSDESVGAEEIREACVRLRASLPGSSVVCVDLTDLAEEVGPTFFDSRIRALAGCPWSLAGQRAIVAEIRRLASLRNAPPKKVLAVDFDGVLWRGTLAEDGEDSLRSAADLQEVLLELKQRGVLLVGLTKNDAATVASVWRIPGMVLAPEDFVSVRANWKAKTENLASVAHELNLGTDSFVFADDNPGECAAMAVAHPEVEVFHVSKPTASVARRLARRHFPDFGATAEDFRRTASYRAASARRTAAAGRTLEDYLVSLGTVVDFHRARPDEVPRLAQLSQRCNQFNVRQRRFSEADLLRILTDPSQFVYSVAVQDRYGDLGLIALLVIEVDGAAARLEEWVMSCRAMNRRIEDETWVRLRTDLRARGVSRLEAEVRPTDRNGPVAGLFVRLPVF